MPSPTPTTSSLSEIESLYRDFEQTALYRWADRVITGPLRWVILPLTGVIDAFVVILPTELIVVLYMMRNQHSSWMLQAAITAFFAALGYVLLAYVIAWFGVDAVSWLGSFTWPELAQSIDNKFAQHIVLFAIAAGATSVFPMPMTVFAVLAGLFSWSMPLLFVGAFIGKFVRFSIFAYGTQRWGSSIVAWYFRNANIISLVLAVLLVGYLVIR